MAGLILKNLEKKYEASVVGINNFNIEIDDKEFIVLMGVSGCRK